MAPAVKRAALGVLAAAAFLSLLSARALRDPAVAFLAAHPGARWIALDEPLELKAFARRPRFVRFRTRVVVPEGVPSAELIVRARAQSQAVFDGVEVLAPGGAGPREERRVLLTAAPGPRELLVVVRAEDGPPLLWARAPAWGLATGTDWDADIEGGGPRSSRDATLPRRAGAFTGQVGAAAGFARTLPWLLLVAGLAYWAGRRRVDARVLGWACAVVFAAWAVTGWAAWTRLSPAIGFDAAGHLRHARLIAEEGRLPRASEGWQLFEPPLHFVLAAGLRVAARARLSPEDLDRLCRLPALLAGALLGPMCLLAARAARPGRHDAALDALLVGSFLPASLAAAQTPANQSLAGTLAAAALAAAFVARARGTTPGRAAGVGALLGAAALAKATAFASVPPVLAALVMGGKTRRARWAATGATAFLSAGGVYYLAVWAREGKPILGGWDLSGALAWSQDPGLRARGDFLRFGESLIRPVYSGVFGFWDALYSSVWLDGWNSGLITAVSRPPWPENWQAAAAWWGLLPTGLAVFGAVRAVRSGDEAGLIAAWGLGAGLAALLWLFLSLPIYSTVKASYLLGLTPLLALLVADGVEGFRAPWRAAARALLCAWAVCAWRAHLPL